MYQYDLVTTFFWEQKRLRELLEAPIQNALRQMESHAHLLEASRTAVENMAMDLYVEISSGVDQAVRSWSSWQAETQQAAERSLPRIQLPESFFKSGEDLLAAVGPTALALEAITSEWKRVGESVEDALRFQETFGASILERFAAMASAASEEEFFEEVEAVTSMVEESVEDLPRSPVTGVGRWLAIISILLAVYGLWEQRKSSNEVQSHLKETNRRLAAIESQVH